MKEMELIDEAVSIYTSSLSDAHKSDVRGIDIGVHDFKEYFDTKRTSMRDDEIDQMMEDNAYLAERTLQIEVVENCNL